MLIVSKYKDYYDTVQNTGVDKTCVDYFFFLIGFCGSVYYGYSWTDPKTNQKMVSYNLEGLYKMMSKKDRRLQTREFKKSRIAEV